MLVKQVCDETELTGLIITFTPTYFQRWFVAARVR